MEDTKTDQPPLALTDLLCRCDELQRVSESREHKGSGYGGCFAANGERGCPCCDADDELNGMVFELIDRLHRIKTTIERRRLKWEAETNPNWAGYRAMAKMELTEILGAIEKA